MDTQTETGSRQAVNHGPAVAIENRHSRRVEIAMGRAKEQRSYLPLILLALAIVVLVIAALI